MVEKPRNSDYAPSMIFLPSPTWKPISSIIMLLLDVVGQIRLISGDNLRSANGDATQVLGDRTKDRVFLHLHMKECSNLELNISDPSIFRYRHCRNYRVHDIVCFHTSLLGGDTESIPEITSSSAAITKLEKVTLTEIYQFIKNETPHFHLNLRDANNDTATFVLFDPDAMKLAGRSATDVLNDTIEFNLTYVHVQVEGDNKAQQTNTKIPECLKKIIGRTCEFQIKLTTYNFQTSRQTITVSRIDYCRRQCRPQLHIHGRNLER
ncbi:unnamed protein product [Thlaspi arvense]|uniref:Replication factor A C-terminal domain-containing protein n=1 Tax=Thlaspi arvense TaxID=13288 RepID=A0AAU9SAR8_THLAR|nr:unnamed protein product [Thlaspi arvense]